jgi:hypothetical protein
MKPVLRRTFGAVAIVGALASVVAGRERPTLQLVQPQRGAQHADSRSTAIEGLDLDRLAVREQKPGESNERKVDPFAPRSFSPAAPAEPAKQAKPVAPPLPFRYLGKMLDNGKLAVFLARGSESLSVSAGDRVGEYRVDKVSENEVVFTYLPLKTKQSLPL